MTSLHSMRVVAVLAALTASSATAYAMGHDQSPIAQSPVAIAPEMRLVPIIHRGDDLGLRRQGPTTLEIKIAPGGPGTAGDGNGFDFGLDNSSTLQQPEIKIAPNCPSGACYGFWGG